FWPIATSRPGSGEPVLQLQAAGCYNAGSSYSMTSFLSQWTNFIVARGLRLGGILVLALVCLRLLKTFTKRLVHPAGEEATSRAARMREQQTRTVAGILRSAGTIVIVAVAILMALPDFGFNVAPLAVVTGLASLAVGFGAQNLGRDLINGFLVVFEDQYVVGDVVRIGDTAGRVEHITLRRTVIRDAQGAIVTIPNGEIHKAANLSRDWSQLFLGVTVAADTELEPALATLESLSLEFRADAAWAGTLVDGPRVLGVDSLGASGASLLLQVRTAPTRQDDVARELRRRIAAAFERQGIRATAEQRVAVRQTQSGEGGEEIHPIRKETQEALDGHSES
ncbi:MAG: mechanosensitive ion channel family protein, partial [Bryobacteraceae bacterium]